ncbi:MAG: amidohydrolase family protein, partial [Atopobium sp.]|nr:amidohydrolase family protein [Atopobium sp.]
IDLCRLTGCPLHICHISTARGVELVRAAKKEGLPVTAEVCPHHLFLSEDDITNVYNTNLKMNPPLRTAEDAQALQEAVIDGTVDCIVTDHAPHAAHEKDCEWEIAYFGCIGLETSLPLMLTHMVKTDKLSYAGLVNAMAINPRRILRLEPVTISAGSKADLTLFDPEKNIHITKEYFESKAKNSAFIGATLNGVATDVFVDGKHVLVNGAITPGEEL